MIILTSSLQARGMMESPSTIDTLVLTHVKSGKEYQIPEGELIKCYLNDGSKVKGSMTEVTDDFLVLGIRRIDLSEIKSIQYLPEKKKKRKKRGLGIGFGIIAFLLVLIAIAASSDTNPSTGNDDPLVNLALIFAGFILTAFFIGIIIGLVALIGMVGLSMAVFATSKPRFRLRTRYLTKIIKGTRRVDLG